MKKSVTIIDDDIDLRSLLQLAFLTQGYQVNTFANGDQFLESLREQEPSDLYVIDINLGGVSGSEVCKHLKASPANAKSVVLLISANPELPQLAADAKANDYLLKPFSQKDIIQKVSDHLLK